MTSNSVRRCAIRQTGTRRVLGVVAATVLSAAALMPVPALAQGKDLSDDSVRALVKYAWVITPPKFTMQH